MPDLVDILLESLSPLVVGGLREPLEVLLALGKRVDVTAGTESEAVLEAAGALSGEPGWGRVLVRAEVQWRAGKHASSYRAVRDAKASFPSDGVDLSSSLSEFFFNAIFAVVHIYFTIENDEGLASVVGVPAIRLVGPVKADCDVTKIT